MRDGGGDAAKGVDGGVLTGQQRGLPVQQQAPVLHGACRKIRDGHQVQLGERVGNAKQTLVRRQDRSRGVKCNVQVLDPARINMGTTLKRSGSLQQCYQGAHEE